MELTIDNASLIEKIALDQEDAKDCLMRQWSEENKYRGVVELYCHQFAYAAYLPTQCEPILVEGTQLPYEYYWPVGSRASVPTF